MNATPGRSLPAMSRHAAPPSALFAATLFASAFLLFWVQPLTAKMLLPLLGGTPAVWNTCVLFFQTALLAGYAYTYLSSKFWRAERQALVHAALLLVAALALPLAVPARAVASLTGETNPVLWLLACLLLMVGLPFFVVSTTGPLLQKWFSETRHTQARDPYFLYAASNAGSLAALVGYPVLLEPFLNSRRQSHLWTVLYVVMAASVVLCAFLVRRSATTHKADSTPTPAPDADRLNADNLHEKDAHEHPSHEDESVRAVEAGATPVTNHRRLLWTALAFVPSSLMLGVTTYISTDIASIPLLWVVPLALYLLTLILVFARRQLVPRRLADAALPGAAVILTLVYLSGATEPAWFLVLVHLLFFFIAAMACHGRLADDRPAAKHLPEFYLWVAVGGALGGLLNAVVAPAVFNAVVEYPLAVVLACLLRKPPEDVDEKQRVRLEEEDARGAGRWLSFALPLGLGLLSVVLGLAVRGYELDSLERLAIVLGIPLMAAYIFARRRVVLFALSLGAVMLASNISFGTSGVTVYTHRNFFGVLRVTLAPDYSTLRLYHGSTLHGQQFTDEARQCEPLSYYHREGPLGALFKVLDRDARSASSRRVAVVGLGAGTTVAYAQPGQSWTFYEINPAVLDVAQSGRHFTYLGRCAAAPVNVVLGDARLRLQEASERGYDLIVLDAFSSDAIPVHLMTREALDLYLSKLSDDGVLAFHISNRNLDLVPVVAGLEQSRELYALKFDDSRQDAETVKDPSHWVALARRAETLRDLAADARWQPLQGQAEPHVWTDDFSDIVSTFKW